MAKENTTVLYGWVTGPVRTREISGTVGCEIDILTLRKTGMTDDMHLVGHEREEIIQVITKNTYLAENMIENFGEKEWGAEAEQDPDYEGKFVLIKGTLCTVMQGQILVCPYCGEEVIREKSVSYIDPLTVLVCNFGETADMANALDILHDHIEVGNSSILYGTILREPEYYNEGATELRFPLSVRRKRHIYEDPDDKTADFPWARVFGSRNENYERYVHQRSGIYINGSIQHREFTGQKITCAACGGVFEINGETTECIPYALKYQKNCGEENDDGEIEEREDLAGMPPSENTVLLLGWVFEKPSIGGLDEEGNPTIAKLWVRVYRNKYEGENYSHRGETTTNQFLIRTKNKKLIRYISTSLAAQPAENGMHRGYVVLIKGTLIRSEKNMVQKCPECGEKFKHTYMDTEIEPVGIWKEAGPFTTDEAAFFMHGAIEVGNMVLCHGLLLNDPTLIRDAHFAECRFSIETQRTRNKEDDMYDRADVIATGDRAVEYSESLHEDSVIFINGALRSSEHKDKSDICPHCGDIVPMKEFRTEIVPYQIEYHTNCNIPKLLLLEEEEDEEDLL